MFALDGVAVKKGMAFLAKDGKRQKFVIASVHRDNTVTYLPEKNLSKYNNGMAHYKGKLDEVRVSNETFEADVFKKWIRSQQEITAEKSDKMREAFINFAKMSEDYKEAVKMDIIWDAAHGVPADVVLARMNAVIVDEKSDSFDEGRTEGFADGQAEASYTATYMEYEQSRETAYRY